MAVPELGGTIAADVVSLANGLGALDPIAAARALTAMQQSGDGSGESGGLDIVGMVLSFLAGIVIFLYGVNRLADGLRQIGDDRIKEILARFTTNPLAGVLAGTAATTLLDSSSVTIIMTIALVSAGLLTFTHSLGVVMGANIGTTVSSQVIAFDIDRYAAIALVVGFLLLVIGRSDRQKQIGAIVLGLGLIFFGLETMGDAAEPLKEYQPFIDLMARMENPLLAVPVGALFTMLIQSSSATIAIVIVLASQGLITLPAGIGLMLGAEIGTCADTLVATVGRSAEAVRTGVFHLLFNIGTVILGVIFAVQLAGAAQWLAFGADVPRQIANAHLLFNVLGVVLVIGFTPWIARGLERLIPDRAARGLGADRTEAVGAPVEA
jgi:phosphate:Na+ symporter